MIPTFIGIAPFAAGFAFVAPATDRIRRSGTRLVSTLTLKLQDAYDMSFAGVLSPVDGV